MAVVDQTGVRERDDVPWLWQRLGQAIERRHTSMTERFDHIDDDLATINGELCGLRGEVGGLKGEVGDLKGDVGGLRGEVGDLKVQLGKLESAFERQSKRVEGRLEQLIHHIVGHELGRAPPGTGPSEHDHSSMIIDAISGRYTTWK